MIYFRVSRDGIDAPSEVPEGTTGPVEVSAKGSSEVTVYVSSTGETTQVPVDADGRAQIEIPSGVADGDLIVIVDSDDPSMTATITVVPASST